MAASLVDSSLNNFLNDTFHLTGFQRSFLEFPREFPGVITLFVSAALWFLGSRRLGGVAMIFAAVGIFLIGFSSSSYLTMVVFLLFIVWETISSCRSRPPWGWNWRRTENRTSLGQLNAIRNAATIVGSFIVFIGFKYLNFNYQTSFTIASVIFIIAAVLMFMMQPKRSSAPRAFLKLRKEYSLFYTLSVLSARANRSSSHLLRG